MQAEWYVGWCGERQEMMVRTPEGTGHVVDRQRWRWLTLICISFAIPPNNRERNLVASQRQLRVTHRRAQSLTTSAPQRQDRRTVARQAFRFTTPRSARGAREERSANTFHSKGGSRSGDGTLAGAGRDGDECRPCGGVAGEHADRANDGFFSTPQTNPRERKSERQFNRIGDRPERPFLVAAHDEPSRGRGVRSARR